MENRNLLLQLHSENWKCITNVTLKTNNILNIMGMPFLIVYNLFVSIFTFAVKM